MIILFFFRMYLAITWGAVNDSLRSFFAAIRVSHDQLNIESAGPSDSKVADPGESLLQMSHQVTRRPLVVVRVEVCAGEL